MFTVVRFHGWKLCIYKNRCIKLRKHRINVNWRQGKWNTSEGSYSRWACWSRTKKNDEQAWMATNNSIITKHVVKLAWVLASVSLDRYLFERFSNATGTKCDLFWLGAADQLLGSDMLGNSLVWSPRRRKKVNGDFPQKMSEGRYETRSPRCCCCCYGCSSHHRLLGGSFCIHSEFVCFVPATSEPHLYPSVWFLTMLLSPKHPPHGGSFSVQYCSHSGSTLWFSQQMLLVARVLEWASASLMLPLSAARYLLTSLLRKSAQVTV